jgi:hypothetical protein
VRNTNVQKSCKKGPVLGETRTHDLWMANPVTGLIICKDMRPFEQNQKMYSWHVGDINLQRSLWKLVRNCLRLTPSKVSPTYNQLSHEDVRCIFDCLSRFKYKVRARRPKRSSEGKKSKKHTTVGIRWSSPTQLLIHRFGAYVWQSGRDAQFSPIYGRMW